MQNLLSLLQLYNDDGLQMIHERLRDPISDTLSQLQSAIRQEKTAREWHDKYLVDMGKVFGRKQSQPRNMLSRHKYEALLDRVKVVERIRREGGQAPAHLAVIGEKYRIVKTKNANDEFAKDFLAEKGTGRMLLNVDDLFEVLHKYHLLTGHGRSIAMYNAAKKKYANITVECILIFLVGCLECKKWNKNERKLATLLRPNQHKERHLGLI
uniref:Integrase_H2C2 domain-containing protein n=1 Tax=Globodera pallida TaxID=36090 RepID=A0A183CLE7_GLOPA